MENNELDYINGEYPYGIFPVNHTKIGQQKIKEKLRNGYRKYMLYVISDNSSKNLLNSIRKRINSYMKQKLSI